uniref:Uncharacterized protein n=1 Tax=Rhizophora mucronata TaxID=61149 RepID=A0A2P2P0I8_RHIMU
MDYFLFCKLIDEVLPSQPLTPPKRKKTKHCKCN